MHPLTQLFDDRALARQRDDPCANLCTAASIDLNGHPQARTLVLREIGGQLAVFGNETSPKWQEFNADTPVAIVVWLPTLQLQYRLSCRTEVVPKAIVHESWQLRPDAAKRLDWFYTTHHPQSARLPHREALLERLQSLQVPDPLVAPDTAGGLFLHPRIIDRLDLDQPDRVHDRRHFELVDGVWVESVLVP